MSFTFNDNNTRFRMSFLLVNTHTPTTRRTTTSTKKHKTTTTCLSLCVCVFLYNHKLFYNHTSFLHKCRWQFFRNFLFAFYFQLKYSDNGQLRDIHWMDGWMVAGCWCWMVDWLNGYAKCYCHSFYGHTVIAIINTGFHTKKTQLHLSFIWRSLFYLRQLVSTNIKRFFFRFLFFTFSFMGEFSQLIGFVTLAPDRTVLWCLLISWFIKFDALLYWISLNIQHFAHSKTSVWIVDLVLWMVGCFGSTFELRC